MFNSQTSSPSAADYLGRLQREAPPLYPREVLGADRAQVFAGMMEAALPPEVRSRLAAKRLMVGEVGGFNPDIRTITSPVVEDGDFCIVVNSGLMDFYYAIARAANGAASVYTTSAVPDTQATLDMNDVGQLIADALRNWRSLCQPKLLESVWKYILASKRDLRIRPGEFAIANRVEQLAVNLTTSAVLFMIAHEFGHVALDIGAASPTHHDDESDADVIGLSFHLPSVEARLGRRWALAGVGFAIRVTGSLVHAGAQFSGAYDPPSERLQKLLSSARLGSPSSAFHDEASTLLVNYVDLLDYVDTMLNASPPDCSTEFLEWQTRVRLIAVLEEMALGRASSASFQSMCSSSRSRLESGAFDGVADTLVEYYVRHPEAPGYREQSVRLKMGEQLRQAATGLPSYLRNSFDL